MARNYWVEAGELWVADDSLVTWHGRLEEKPVYSAIALPNTDDAVAILEYEAGPRVDHNRVQGWPNLVRVRADGSVVWRATAIDADDSWVEVRCSDGRLKGHTWSGWLVTLAPDTGLHISKEFTK